MRSRVHVFTSILVTAFLLVPDLGAQQVTGRVTNQLTGEPLAAVQVFIAGSGIGALSQQNGRYLLLNVPAGTHTLSAERIGYRAVTQQITVTAGQTVVQDFALSEEALGLDEIIVTGTPGGTQRRAIGNAVAQVSAAEIQQTVALNSMQDLLGGRTPGIQFQSAAGGVGGGSALTIRGNGSFGLNRNPLIYVDGVRVNNNTEAGPNVGGGPQGNVLDDFNPADIESIEIIKGPAAATLYGTEASAGVIQIITKRGAEGAPAFNVGTTIGSNFLMDPVGKLGTQWSCRNHERPPCDSGELAAQFAPTQNDLFSYNMYEEGNDQIAEGLWPWPSDNIYQNGLTQSYNVDVRGGTQSIRYFLSTNFDDNEGPIWYNTDKAFRFRANVGVVFNENFSLDFASGYVDGETRYNDPVAGDGGTWTDMVWSNGYKLPSVNPSADTRRMGFQEHRPDDVGQVEATREYARFTGSGTLNFTTGDWLNSRAIVGVDRGWDENYTLFPLAVGDVYADEAAGVVRLERPVTTNLSLDWSATARADVMGVGTATSVGAQYYFRKLSEFSSDGEGLPSPLSRTINQIPSASQSVGFEYVENKSVGFYVQEELSLNDRIFLTAAVRFDDNSAFGSEFELEKYPKFSATWVMSDEPFWNVELINSLRLRGAWGKAGRQPDTFAGTNQYAIVAGPSGTAAFDPSSPGNPAVGPEIATELELGFDVALLDDRLAGEFTYFTRRNEDALLGIALPPSLGFSGSRQRNLGRIDNWGWEAIVRTRVYESDALSVSVDFSADHTDNEIKDLGSFPGNRNVRVGYPWPNLTTPYVVLSADYDPTASGIIRDAWGRNIRAMCDSGVPVGEGSQYGVLQGGTSGVCREEVQALNLLAGRGFATYKFSISPMISLFDNAVQIRVLAEGQHGQTGQERELEWGHLYNNTYHSRCECDPVWVAGDRLRDGYALNLFDRAFWKIRELGVRYSLPESLTAQIGAESGSLSVSGRNLWYLWRAQEEIWLGQIADPEKGMANELGNTGANWFGTPPFSSLSAALRLSF